MRCVGESATIDIVHSTRRISAVRKALLGTSALIAGLSWGEVAVAQTALPPLSVEAKKAKAKAKQTTKAAPKQAPAPVAAPVAAESVRAPATQPANPISDTPLATQTTATDIQRNEISSITDLGNTTEPGVEFSPRTDGFNIRGMEGPRVTTVIDGIPQPYLENYARGSTATINAPTNADGGGAAFDFRSISALDVLRGADSSRVGSGGLGGAVVLRTLEPEDIITTGSNWGGLAKTTYDSRDRSVNGSLALAGRAGPWLALVQGSYTVGHETETKGSRDTFGATRTEANPLDFDQSNFLFKLRHDGGSGHRIGFTAEQYKYDAAGDLATNWNRTAALTGYNPYNFFGNEFTQRRRLSVDYSYRAPVPGGLVDTAFAVAYWQELNKSSGADGTQRNGTYYLRDVDFDHETFGFVGGMTGRFHTGGFNHRWQTGIDVARFTANQFTTILPTSGVGHSQADIPRIDGTKFGMYVDDRISVDGSRFALTPGVRFDWHQYTPKATEEWLDNSGSGLFGLPPENSGSRVTPKLLATYQLAPRFELFAQWAAAYRAPTINELYVNFTNPVTGYAQIGNPDLKPETGHGFEVGANFGDKLFGGRIGAFHNWYRNFIATTPLTPNPAYPTLPFGLTEFINIAEVEISGVELRMHQRLGNGIIVHGGLAYYYGQDGDGNRLPTIAPVKGLLGVGYEGVNWGVDLTGIFVGKYNDNFANPATPDTTFDAPGYVVANLTGWWEPEFLKGLRIQGTVKNLFDATYYDALALRTVNLSAAASQPLEFYSAPGRSFIVSATHRF